jgi:hypothetical protein
VKPLKLALAIGIGLMIALASTIVFGQVIQQPQLQQVEVAMEDVRARPTLSPEQQQTLREVALTDPAVQTLLSLGGATITNATPSVVGVWHTGPGQVIGGTVLLKLTLPLTISGTWPGFNYNEGASPPYTKTWIQATYTNITALDIIVDLERREAISVLPERGAKLVGEVIYPPGVVPVPQPTGR